jgi:hypothetical protein
VRALEDSWNPGQAVRQVDTDLAAAGRGHRRCAERPKDYRCGPRPSNAWMTLDGRRVSIADAPMLRWRFEVLERGEFRVAVSVVSVVTARLRRGASDEHDDARGVVV